MNAWIDLPRQLPVFDPLCRALSRPGVSAVTGLSRVHRAHLTAALFRQCGRSVLVLTPTARTARALAADLAALLEGPVPVLTGRELVLYPMAGVSRQAEQQRLRLFWQLQGAGPVLAVADVAAAALYTIPPAVLRRAAVELRPAGTYDLEELTRRLTLLGYQRVTQVEGVGQFARRGGIVDIFSPAHPSPIRLELWGEEVDSLTSFDPASQRRGGALEGAVCLPVREALPQLADTPLPDTLRRLLEKTDQPQQQQTLQRDLDALGSEGLFAAADRYLPLLWPPATALDYLPPDGVVAVDDSAQCLEALGRYEGEMARLITDGLERGHLTAACNRFSLPPDDLPAALAAHPAVLLDSFSPAAAFAPDFCGEVDAKELPAFGGSWETAAEELRRYQRQGYRTVVLAPSPQRQGRMAQLLTARGVTCAVSDQLPPPGGVAVARGSLSAGVAYPTLAFALLSEGQLLPARKRRREAAPAAGRERVRALGDLQVGELVVHEHHGLARFAGLVTMEVGGMKRDYAKLCFAGTDVLYVPATALDLVSKYIGAGEGAAAPLSRLGGTQWEKARQKARSAAKKLAIGLLELYAAREKEPGYAFPPDDDTQREFEEGFPYEETADQLLAARQIKADMEQPRPMDRLLCGDVGFGKTEVALRAVMKCLLGGKQAAMLPPTTVLARQHFLTAQKRFAPFPVTVELLSRQRTAKEQRDILARLRAGKIDFLIGTHKLLGKNLRFRDLGLLVVDEEQRFGVGHKETLKDLTRGVDVLTLSATPIPRTLNMALTGIRDMSTLEQAPAHRQPVQTYVLEYDPGVVLDAIRRELDRGGQCYYLHNRVESIDQCALRLQRELGGAVVAAAHGKMGQGELERVMSRFSAGEIDVLVCTTIIETGLDIPNVNTLVIEDADRFGLSQLHQIRGRVGRSERRAYAYLTYSRGKALSEVSQKRLSAIREFAEFGSGFQIAMRDLEIRGAGNLLGPEQSGHMASVGYEMYLKLLAEEVAALKGRPAAPDPAQCTVDLPVEARLPDSYVSDPAARVELYRRISRLRTAGEREELLDELIDRFGEPPAPAVRLCDVALLRARAGALGASELTMKEGRLRLLFPRPDLRVLSAVCAQGKYRGRLLLDAAAGGLSLRPKKGEGVLACAAALLDDLEGQM